VTLGSLAWALALLLQAGQPAPDPPGTLPDPLPDSAPSPTVDELRAASRAKALRDSGPVIAQLVREAGSAGYRATPDGGSHMWIETRTRSSDTDGVCENELIRIEMNAAADPAGDLGAIEPSRPARIRAVETSKRYHLLRDPWNKPTWQVSGAALEAECARISGTGYSFYEAPSSDEFKVALLSLERVRSALADADSPLIRIRCGRIRGDCGFDRKRWIAGIDPLFSGDVKEPAFRSTCGDGGRRCQRFLLLDYSICGSWDLEIESDYAEPLRLRSATFTARPNGLIHCGDDGP
jgi:hypothetical protein